MLHATFIGGGPAGLAPLVWAARTGQLSSLCERGLAVLFRSQKVGSGKIGGYAITSDTLSETFIECLEDCADTGLLALRDHPATLQVARHRGGGIALPTAALFLEALGETMGRSTQAAGGHILTQCEAIHSRRCSNGSWLTRVRSPDRELDLPSRNLVVATGATESRAALVER